MVVDEPAKAAYTWLGDQWVSFDTPDTLGMKKAAAKDLGLGGLMVRGWGGRGTGGSRAGRRRLVQVLTARTAVAVG